MTQPVQLSHDEFLLLLGLLRLPMPLALGEHPIEGYTEQSLNIALASAMSGLMAREYIRSSAEVRPEDIRSDVGALITATALADRCLMVGARQSNLMHASHYSVYDQMIVAHSSLGERIHRLEELSDGNLIVERLTADIIPHSIVDTTPPFVVDAEALGLAVEATSVGQIEAARNILLRAGISSDIAISFINQLGTSVVRYALVVMHNLQTPQPIARSAVVLQGIATTYYAEEVPAQPSRVEVRAVEHDTLGKHLQALVDELLDRSLVA